jgi:hypothetical protein
MVGTALPLLPACCQHAPCHRNICIQPVFCQPGCKKGKVAEAHAVLCLIAARAQRHSQAANKEKAAVLEEMSRTAVETESIARWAGSHGGHLCLVQGGCRAETAALS